MVLVQMIEEMDAEEMNSIMLRFKELMINKYSDVILILSVAVAFGMLLVISSMG